MKNTIYQSTLIFTLVCFASMLSAQSLRLSSGIGQSYLYDIQLKESDSYQSNYTSGSSHFLKLDYEDSNLGWLGNFSIKYEKYSPQVSFGYPALICYCGPFPSDGGAFISNSQIQKSTLSIGSYPLNINVTRKMKFRIGLEISKTINRERYIVDSDNKRATESIGITDDALKNNNFNVNTMVELQFTKLMLGNGMTIIPLYNAYFSVNPEFEHELDTRSIRHNLGISIGLNVEP